jgi:hypothetical protein
MTDQRQVTGHEIGVLLESFPEVVEEQKARGFRAAIEGMVERGMWPEIAQVFESIGNQATRRQR